MKKPSMLTNVRVSMVIMDIVLIWSMIQGLVMRFDKSFNPSDTACIVSYIVMLAIAIIGGMLGVFGLSKTFRGTLKKMNELVNMVADGNVDWEMKPNKYREYDEFFAAMVKLVDATKKQADVAMQVAEGDLTVQPEIRSDKDELGKAMKSLVETNNQVMRGIGESSIQLTAGAEQVAAASQALAQGSTEQASAIEQITASMHDIAVKTSSNADNAHNMEMKVQEMLDDARKGHDAVTGVNTSMSNISESSHNINKVIKTIDDIAFQTNILALNATVEAARAGVHGRGFAVVAEEVKNLAELSSKAAQETAELIQHSINMVEDGSKQVDEMTEAISRLSDAIDNIAGTVSEVAAASEEQATSVAQINQAIDQVSMVVQTNSATSEQCASAAEELSNQSQNLRELIARFKVSSHGNTPAGTYNSSYAAPKSHSFAHSFAAPKYEPQQMKSYDDESVDNESIISLEGNLGKY